MNWSLWQLLGDSSVKWSDSTLLLPLFFLRRRLVRFVKSAWNCLSRVRCTFCERLLPADYVAFLCAIVASFFICFAVFVRSSPNRSLCSAVAFRFVLSRQAAHPKSYPTACNFYVTVQREQEKKERERDLRNSRSLTEKTREGRSIRGLEPFHA